MKTTRTRSQRGVAGIEMALILVCFIFIIPVVLLFGRVMWTYYVLKQATADAARFYSMVTPAMLADTPTRVALNLSARQMVADAVAGAGITPVPAAIDVDLDCYGCTTLVAPRVEVAIDYYLEDKAFFMLTGDYLSDNPQFSWELYAKSTVPYATRALTK